jgi:hypothetical protein
LSVYVHTVASYLEEKSMSANAHGNKSTSYALAHVLVLLLTKAIVSTVIGSGLRAVFAASRS